MNWHCMWVDEVEGWYEVWCIPHGLVGRCDTNYGALLLGYEHDVQNGTYNAGD